MASPQQSQADLFETYFCRADSDCDGRIAGAEAVAFFKDSGLSKQVLARGGEGSQNSEQMLDDDSEEFEIESDELEFEGNELDIDENDVDNTCEHVFNVESTAQEDGNGISLEEDRDLIVIDGQETLSVGSPDDTFQSQDYSPPSVGMEFESYEDAYNYYNCYAKELGFAIRVKSSWTKRNSKEKRGAVLCCNCEGFKTLREANNRRKETRTGCLAMIRLRLVESNMWRVDEVKLEHNHSFDPERVQNSKSHKKIVGAKRKMEPNLDVEVRTIKLYRSPAADQLDIGCSNICEGEVNNQPDQFKRLKLEKGDAQVMNDYFCRAQQTNPNFFYIMDLNEEGFLRNVFWIDSRSRATYSHFSDIIALDTTCLSCKYEIPLLTFVGVNHHGQSILVGCGLLADETYETYIWLFRAWLTCMMGRPPQAIITNRCISMQIAIAEVFPRAHHCVSLPHIVKSIIEGSGELQGSDAYKKVLYRIIYDSVKVDEFELGWEDMIQHFGLKDHESLSSLYKVRERWAPVYLRDVCFAGMLTFQRGESLAPFFDGYLHKETTLKDFFDIHDLVLEKKRQKEAHDDSESSNSVPVLRTRCYYEFQLSKLYTNEIFKQFQDEVVMMSSCYNISQIHANGPVVTYLMKECVGEGKLRDVGNFEVMYDKASGEVRCICGSFSFKGFLCRHALCILSYNGVEEIPSQYILSRWRKDFKRLYVPKIGSSSVDTTNPVQLFDHLYRRAMQVVELGAISQDHYMVAWQAFKESLNKVRLVADKNI